MVAEFKPPKVQQIQSNSLRWCWCMQVKEKVAVHVPCSSKKMGIEAAFMNIACRCAQDVQPSAVPCCGMAGDRGMRCEYPSSVCAATVC